MATWADLLSDLRADLMDTSDTPKWTDKMLYLYSKDAIRDYSTWFPKRIDRAELSLTGDICSLPSDFLEDITVECPLDTYLERRNNRPGVQFRKMPIAYYYFIQGGNLYINSPLVGNLSINVTPQTSVFLTYFAAHPVPTSETDGTFSITLPDADLELVRLYVKAKVFGQMRDKQAALDRFKVGTGNRTDNPLTPDVDNLMLEYRRKIGERTQGGAILLYRTGRAGLL